MLIVLVHGVGMGVGDGEAPAPQVPTLPTVGAGQ